MISELERWVSYSTKSFLVDNVESAYIAGYGHELAAAQPPGDAVPRPPSDPRQIDPRRQPSPGRAGLTALGRTRGGVVLLE